MPQHELKFEAVKETKNTVKFKEVPPPGKPPVIDDLYVQKWAAGTEKELTMVLTIGKKK